MASFHSESLERLYKTIVNLQSVEECAQYFEDLCTIKELQDMAQRLDTAILLDQGLNYQQIIERVGISTATISRVSRCLNYGAGGYKNAIKRLEEPQ